MSEKRMGMYILVNEYGVACEQGDNREALTEIWHSSPGRFGTGTHIIHLVEHREGDVDPDAARELVRTGEYLEDTWRRPYDPHTLRDRRDHAKELFHKALAACKASMEAE